LIELVVYNETDKCITDDTKGAVRRSPNCIKKQKARSMERRYMSHHRNSVTNCYATQNFTEIEQSAAKSWPENDF